MGTPEKIRTSNRLIRSQVLYPVELRVQQIIIQNSYYFAFLKDKQDKHIKSKCLLFSLKNNPQLR